MTIAVSVIVPALVLLVGLLMWVLCANAKLQKIGEYMFFVGLLWLVFQLAGKRVDF